MHLPRPTVLLAALWVVAGSVEAAPSQAGLLDVKGRATIPPPPSPEPIQIVELPLPPVAPTDDIGACTLEINPRKTGCMGKYSFFQSGNFLSDDKHVVALVNFTGAPDSPDPASIYSGLQLILVKADGTTFSNGDPWKCVTCGVPPENMINATPLSTYPQAFRDGIRVLAGYSIVDCGTEQLASDDCTPDKIHIYPLRWNVKADGSGSGGNIRELRIHPDNVHLGFNAETFTGTSLGEFSYFGRLEFNPSPTDGVPLSARYDIVNVTVLHQTNGSQVLSTNASELIFNPEALNVGEFRGFSGLGDEIAYLGSNVESGNFDVFAVNIQTGKVRRITSDTGYTDPLHISPDNQWSVVLTTLNSSRMEFISAMRGVPPLIDTISVGVTASVRNNLSRRFFQPWLLDYYGSRGSYNGQMINAGGDGTPGSINDPNWNAMADPKWSNDGTMIAYYQTLVIPPECGGPNPLPCPVSTAPGGRTSRLMLATLTGRKPLHLPPAQPVSDSIPWGTPYVPGSAPPSPPPLLNGTYTLQGKVQGHAQATFTLAEAGTYIRNVAVVYFNYSDDGIQFISGFENVTATPLNLTSTLIDWYANMTSVGEVISTKFTSDDGFHVVDDEEWDVFIANGTLTTTVGSVVYTQPFNYS
ncbi:hypothetical protein TCE0_060r18635 [Talaromyces pinophilus]|jgi:hypothetical protein|uniref:Saponin hydrolase n=1 Tax=Talaromyces pinophilus TaxID=128442 RepID=A0A6V8HPQ5_TALPI|nr:hypothetical protein TCE0_060r18635 [Talaromyces pinophilus]